MKIGVGWMIVVNLYAGPSAGKSTMAAGLFHEAKSAGLNCELVTEYAKDVVWEKSFEVLNDQMYIFGKQNHRQRILLGQVDLLITDSPLMLSTVYGEPETISSSQETFNKLVRESFDSYDNMNFYIQRVKKFQGKGRVQDEERAQDLDDRVFKMLDAEKIYHSIIMGNKAGLQQILTMIMRQFDESKDGTPTLYSRSFSEA